jgi:hypothetical protein
MALAAPGIFVYNQSNILVELSVTVAAFVAIRNNGRHMYVDRTVL